MSGGDIECAGVEVLYYAAAVVQVLRVECDAVVGFYFAAFVADAVFFMIGKAGKIEAWFFVGTVCG